MFSTVLSLPSLRLRDSEGESLTHRLPLVSLQIVISSMIYGHFDVSVLDALASHGSSLAFFVN